MTICGITCSKDGLTYSILVGNDVEDSSLVVPASETGERPAVLDWLLIEAQRLFENKLITDVRILAPGTGPQARVSSERCEVEACVKIAARRAGASVWVISKEAIRKAHGISRTTGAYKELLARPEVDARGSAARRDQYLMVTAPDDR